MTIKHRIQLNGFFLFISIIIISGVFLVSDIVVQRTENGVSRVSTVASEAMTLYGLTQDYTQNPSFQLQQTWETQNLKIKQILNDSEITTYGENQSFLELRKNSNTIESLFSQIIESPNDQALRDRLVGQITLHTKSFATESNKLAKAMFDQSELVRKRSAIVLFVLLELLFLAMVSVIIYLNRTVLRPLTKLTEIIRKAEQGDLSVSLPIRDAADEVGILGRAFNAMLKKLSVQTQGLKNEKIKDEALFKDLADHVAQLEDSRKAMANLLDDFEKEQRALSEANAKDEAMLNSSGEGMLAVDENKTIIAINGVAENLLGLKKGEALGKKYYDVFEVRDNENNIIPTEKRPLDIVLSTGQKFTTPLLTGPINPEGANKELATPAHAVPTFYTKKDGTKFPVSLIVTPIIVNNEIAGAIDIFHDITREQEIEKLRVDFLALASHQLRTPLSGTKWLIETMQRGVLGDLNNKQKEYLGQLYQVNERMITLVSDMLNVLKLENATALVNVEQFSLKKLFDDVLVVMSPEAKKRGITIKVDYEENQNLVIETNLQMLRSSVESLVSNAINYSEDGSEVVLRAEVGDSAISLSVEDNGIGIPEVEQKRIFERFYRASNAKIARPEGSGLGLYMATLLADILGATVSFESQVGKGSRFHIRLPKHIIRNKS